MKTLKITISLILLIAVVAAAIAHFYTPSSGNVDTQIGYRTISLCINYGNGTVVWYNNTQVAKNETLFTITRLLADVEYKKYPIGVYITSINGVKENSTKTGGYAWLWYLYNFNKSVFELGSVGADRYIPKNGDIIMWKYERWGK